MKARVWKEQVDLFEITILEQLVELAPLSLSDLATDQSIDPIVLVGKALSKERVSSFRQIASNAFKSGTAMLLVPPFGDYDISSYVDTPASIRLVRRGAASDCKIIDPEWLARIGSLLRIRSDHYIDTALAAGVVCVDGEGKTTLLRFQPKNTTGALFISTLQLLSYTALTDESNRIALLSEVLEWKNVKSDLAIGPEDTASAPQPPTKEDISAVLLALCVLPSLDHNRLLEVMDHYFNKRLSDEALHNVLIYLESEGVLQYSDRQSHFKIVVDRLTQAIEDLGLHAYARELKELAQSSTEVLK